MLGLLREEKDDEYWVARLWLAVQSQRPMYLVIIGIFKKNDAGILPFEKYPRKNDGYRVIEFRGRLWRARGRSVERGSLPKRE